MKETETKLVRIDQQVLNRNKPDRFALPLVIKGSGATREYKIDGEWKQEQPTQKPEGTRLVFDLESFRTARDVYFAWQDIASQKEDNPVRPEECLERLLESMLTGSPLVLFVPWGVRPEGKQGQSEIAVMDKLQTLQAMLKARKIDTQVMIMPADLYATEVNKIKKEKVDTYFAYIKELASERRFFVKPWSEIRDENETYYRKRASELTREVIKDMLPPMEIQEAIARARRRSGFSSRAQIEKSAFAYLRERIIEAEIVEVVYKPIKISCVSKNKDNDVDRDLPRLYVIPNELRFPWLKEN